jgi:predicted amidophosphoribosyltransferase
MRSAVLAAKRPGGDSAAAWLADRLWKLRAAELAPLGIDLVIPVPQHWTRRVVAPQNAAESIARRLAARLNAPFRRHILVKTRRTPKQTSLAPSARRENLRGCFHSLRPLHGRRVLLVDDVLTTGTTANRASRALLDVGAEAVWVAAPARGVGA